jgi:hypothetical protein
LVQGNTSFGICGSNFILFLKQSKVLYFWFLEAHNHYYSSRIISTIGQLMFEKIALLHQHIKNDQRIVKQLAKMLGFQQDNQRTFHTLA